ncbi:hypothetical protein ABMA27_014322 [Loxostege sticticalis]|uniref:Uncharacterized protein n=1 Tax=Loxostege sticticalis TaxID=481309 RepID=A0ABR3I8I4_LOXSC
MEFAWMIRSTFWSVAVSIGATLAIRYCGPSYAIPFLPYRALVAEGVVSARLYPGRGAIATVGLHSGQPVGALSFLVWAPAVAALLLCLLAEALSVPVTQTQRTLH